MKYLKGAKFLTYPGAFNTTTGPAHWELLQRARAVDNQAKLPPLPFSPPTISLCLSPSQVFVAAISPARNPESKYQAWGHSSVVDPW